MTTNQPPITYAMTSPTIGAYPNLFVARAYKDKRGVESPNKTFGLRLLFKPDHPDLPGIRQKIVEAAQREWPSAVFGDAPGQFKVDWPLKSGDDLAAKAAAESPPKDQSHYRGFLVLNASTDEKYPPGLGVVRNGVGVDVPFLPPEARASFSGDFYGGMECLVQFSFKAYAVGNNVPGVKAYLSVVQSLAPQGARNAKLEGGGGPSAGRAFGETLKGHISSVDPRGNTGGMP